MNLLRIPAMSEQPFRRLAWVTDSTQRAQLLERLEELAPGPGPAPESYAW
jgi:hypothetical protein